MAKFDLRVWAVKGAEQRLVELAEEARAIFAAFPELRAEGRGFDAKLALPTTSLAAHLCETSQVDVTRRSKENRLGSEEAVGGVEEEEGEGSQGLSLISTHYENLTDKGR
jgi:hypothetical protein